MRYLVHTSGQVAEPHSKAYVVKAGSAEEAAEVARQNFQQEFGCENVEAAVQKNPITKRAIAALVLMLIAILISLKDFQIEKGIWIWKKTEEFLITPDMRSCIFAIFFYAIYIVRFKGVKRTLETPMDIAFTVLSIFLLSSVFQLLFKGGFKLFGFIQIPWLAPDKLFVIVVIASLLGVKLVSAICLALIMLAAFCNISTANEAMGTWGVVYVMCAFMGILFYLSVEPAVLEAFPQIRGSFVKTAKTVQNDFSGAKETLDNVKKDFSEAKEARKEIETSKEEDKE